MLYIVFLHQVSGRLYSYSSYMHMMLANILPLSDIESEGILFARVRVRKTPPSRLDDRSSSDLISPSSRCIGFVQTSYSHFPSFDFSASRCEGFTIVSRVQNLLSLLSCSAFLPSRSWIQTFALALSFRTSHITSFDKFEQLIDASHINAICSWVSRN